MLLVHDLVEIDAGDLFLYAAAAQHARQEEAERAAADRIFALLPDGQAERVRALWDEFEERSTPEARFARALDRLRSTSTGPVWSAMTAPMKKDSTQTINKLALPISKNWS